jgi:hypothetical protein
MAVEIPSTLNQLIHEVLAQELTATQTRADVLLSVLRKYHFWPALQMKKFFDRSGLVLLHNTYKRTDVDSFQQLYDECRSVVLDLDAPEGENIVVTLANVIPQRFTAEQYQIIMADSDECEVSYEGTVIYVYEHNGKWHFGTTGCPTVNSSRYFHPTKSHGAMLDEFLAKHFSVEGTEETDRSQALRDAFTAQLDVTKSYAFVLVHHENGHIMDYTQEFGAEYAELIHISTRDRTTLSAESLITDPLAAWGIKYAQRFSQPDHAVAYMAENNVYGFIVKKVDGQLLKVSSAHIVTREECDLGNPNKWHNMLWVYMQNKPSYHINDYIHEFAADLEFPTDSLGRDMAPTYIIHTVICTMRDILYDLYVATTAYNPSITKFRMNKMVDASLPPILRFHLAQLRHFQVNGHSHAFLTPKAVYHYICHHQTLKNTRTLINFFATTSGHNMTFRQAECFGVLNQLLSE